MSALAPADVPRPPHVAALETRLQEPGLEPLLRGELLAELAWELRRLDTQASLEFAKEALQLAETSKHDATLAAALLARGFARQRLADYEGALADAERALASFEQLADPAGSYKALNLLGIVYGQLGNLPKALSTFLDTRSLCEDLSDNAGAAAALNNAARAYTLLGDYSSALELHLNALQRYKTSGDSEGMARTLGNVGSAYFALERYEDALVSYQRAHALQGEWRDPHVNAMILQEIGQTHLRLGNLPQAETYIRESKRLFQSSGDRTEAAHSLYGLGAIRHAQGNLAEAKIHFQRATAISQEVGDRVGEISSGLALADVWLEQTDPDAALPLLTRSLTLAEETQSKAEIYQTHKRLALAHELKEDYQQAYWHHKQYAALKDEVFNESSDRKLQSLRVTFQVEQSEREQALLRLKNNELAEMNLELERLAREDALTELCNRRHFDSEVRKLYHDAVASSGNLTVIICDVDYFKQINDRFSHQLGDEVLVTLARLFEDKLRKDDLIARYGGEEFVFALPNTDSAQAYQVCERLRLGIASYDWQQLHPDLKVTISAGINDQLELGDVEKMLTLADDKLYEAKRAGRNRICV